MNDFPPDFPVELLDRARAGDLSAFSELLEEIQPRILAQALAFCGDEHMAKDLVQETMLAAWRGLERFDGSCRFFTWLYVILLRQHQRSLGWFSRRLPLATLHQTIAAERLEPRAESEGEAVERVESEWLRAIVSALPTRHRDVIHLRFYGEASEAEVASALGISVGTVKSRLHNALKKIRQMKEKVNRFRQQSH